MHTTFSPLPDEAAALRQAASLWGIESEYYDIWGKHHVVEPEVIRSILATLGVASASLEQLNQSIERHMAAEFVRLAPQSIVAFADEFRIPVSTPEVQITSAAYELTIRWESGKLDHIHGALDPLKTLDTAEFHGVPYVRKEIPLASDSPLGYHTAELRVGDLSTSIHIVLCPRRAYMPPALADGQKSAGLAVSLYSLRSERKLPGGKVPSRISRFSSRKAVFFKRGCKGNSSVSIATLRYT